MRGARARDLDDDGVVAWDGSLAAPRHPVARPWMTGGSLALFARNAPGVLYTGLAVRRVDLRGDAAARVRCPALVIMAANENHHAAQERRGAGAAHRGQPHRYVPDRGHMLVAEQPDATLDALIAFFCFCRGGLSRFSLLTQSKHARKGCYAPEPDGRRPEEVCQSRSFRDLET